MIANKTLINHLKCVNILWFSGIFARKVLTFSRGEGYNVYDIWRDKAQGEQLRFV